MNAYLKYALLAVTGLLLSLVLGLLIFVLSFNVDKYRQEIITLVEQRTGRDFSIRGELNLAPSLIPTIVIEEAAIGNPAWARRPVMASLGRLKARIALLPLLQQRIVIHRVVLAHPLIHLEIGPDGRGNWVFREGAEANTSPEHRPLPVLDIRELQIDAGQITYHGHAKSPPFVFNIKTLTASARDIGNTLDLKLAGHYEELPVRLDGEVGSVAGLFGTEPYPLSLQAEIGAATARVEGHIEQPQKLSGIDAQLEFTAQNLADFNRAARVNWRPVGPLKLQGRLSGGPDRFAIKPFTARLAESDLSGEIVLLLSEQRPALQAQLESGALDLTPFQDEKDQEDGRVFSEETFDLSFLNLFDAEAHLQARHVRTRKLELNELDLPLSLRDGTLKLQPRARIADGRLIGDLRIAAGTETPSFDIRLDISNMLPEQLPSLREDPPIRDSRTDIQFSGRGSGHSEAEIAAGLDGALLIQVGRGQLLDNVADVAGTDLIFSAFKFINPLADQEQQSELICGVMNFDIRQGVARADEGIALQTSKVNVLGSGLIDLRSEAIAFRAKPRAREGLGISLSQLGEGIYIGGTLSNPRPTTDLEGALRTAGAVGAAVATGGLSLLAQGLFDRTFTADDPCAVALGKRPAPAQPRRTQRSSTVRTEPAAPPAGTSQPQPAERKNPLERAADKLDKILTDLFGD